ncbi:hypothetical protein K8T06_07210, partial [bacterium]|nr:hypothetical protein [bacterium]
MTHVLNIPNMVFTSIYKERPEWNKRYPDGIFQLEGLFDHGCHIFDKGTKTPTYAVEPIKRFTQYMSGYFPDTPYNKVFSIRNVRSYRFRTPDSKYRMIVWRDFGRESIEDYTLFVPFTTKKIIHILDLISNIDTPVEIQTSQMGNFITIPRLNTNPLLITPSLNTAELPNLTIAPYIRSDVESIDYFTQGRWSSTIHIANPRIGENHVEIIPYNDDGSLSGTPFEHTLSPKGSLHLDLASVYEPFMGYVKITTSEQLPGMIEHHLQTDTDIRGCISSLITLPADDSELVSSRFLSTDWEVSDKLLNLITLVNSNDSEATASITVFDETGSELDSNSQVLAPNGQCVIPIENNSQDYRYGVVDINTEIGVLGQITRFSSGFDTDIWQETPLNDDSKMVTELTLKSSTISDADLYSRIVISNPWSEEITGIVTERDADKKIIAEISLSIPGHETHEIVLDSTDVSTIEFKIDNDVRVFGRKEDTLISTNGGSEASSSTGSVKTDMNLSGTMFLPYFDFDNLS